VNFLARLFELMVVRRRVMTIVTLALAAAGHTGLMTFTVALETLTPLALASSDVL